MSRIKLVHNDTLSCESILRRMPDGGLIIICQCGDVSEPAPDNRVYAFLSYDDGETWSDGILVREEDGRAVYCTEVRVENGEIIAYLTVHNGHFIDWQCETAISSDNGKTWRKGKSIVDKFTFVRGAITMSNGEMLIPAQMYNVTEKQNEYLKANNLYVHHSFYRLPEGERLDGVESNVFIRKKGGEDFEMFRGPKQMFEKFWCWSEPTVVEIAPGKLLMLLRYCGTGFLWKSVSEDYGRTWTKAEKTDIPSPGNKSKMIMLDRGRIALIHTPNPNATPTSINNRFPLEVWISEDGGETWQTKLNVGAAPGNCSYPDGIWDEENHRLLFAYEFNRKDIYFVDMEIPE